MTDVKETAERISDDLLASMLSEAVNEDWEDFALALRELQSLRASRHADAQEGGEVDRFLDEILELNKTAEDENGHR